MKSINYGIMGFFCLFSLIGCTSESSIKKDERYYQQKCDSLKNIIESKDTYIQSLKDSISIYSFPADQRYNSILSLINNKKYDEAKRSIQQLKNVFPKSKEANLVNEQLSKILKMEEETKIENERIKSLGFKAVKTSNVAIVNTVKCSFGNFSFSRTFTFGYCSDVNEYSYRTADKDCTYLVTSMSMSTSEKYASVPSFYVCKIIGGKAIKITSFSEEYTSWSSYGAEVGNYSDDTHDFSKVNSVKYKLGAEISMKEAKLPLIIITSKSASSIPDSVDVDYISKNCVVVKTFNFNRL